MNKIKNIIRPNIKKILAVTACVGIVAFYFYKKHQYDKELMDKMNIVMTEISQGERKLSGVYLQQRRPFIFFGWVQ